MHKSWISLTVALFIAAIASQPVAFAEGKHKVVYQVTEPEVVDFALRNMANHIKGVGGPDNIDIHLVVIGDAMDALVAAKADPKIKEQLEKLQKDGLKLEACGNTMKKKKLTIGDLIPGFEDRPEGGVVRVADLQEQGYAYIRP